jgi:hypothetical protein
MKVMKDQIVFAIPEFGMLPPIEAPAIDLKLNATFQDIYTSCV